MQKYMKTVPKLNLYFRHLILKNLIIHIIVFFHQNIRMNAMSGCITSQRQYTAVLRMRTPGQYSTPDPSLSCKIYVSFQPAFSRGGGITRGFSFAQQTQMA